MIDCDIMVLVNFEIVNLLVWVIVLVVVGGLVVVFLIVVGLFFVILIVIFCDLIKMQIKLDISEKGEFCWVCIGVFIVVIIVGYFGINLFGFVVVVVVFVFGLVVVFFFFVIILGIFDKWMNMQGVVIGMVVGISLMVWYMLKFKFGIFDGGKVVVVGLKDGWWFGILLEGFGIVVMFVNLVVLMVVLCMMLLLLESVQQIVEDICIL